MKKIILLSAMVIASMPGFAATTGNDALRKFISQNIAFPEFLKTPNMSEKVTVSFVICDDRSIEIKSISTDNDQLKAHLKRELETLKVKPEFKFTETLYTMNLSFKMKQ